ncbi:MAG: twin-arginine translocase TatA/TatE family subunit, partial [Desulfobacula sp.]|uniref:twin-arginine translocase TatA/TatE family subunit n=1 Tax=Desulfobacula sp. TaxID=2593537 RepID=UPI0025BBC1F9|nr:twin-arginine translocase TatA/TatE family subunit [Desulfobacula sp.]MCD4722394.1 twin-arginine translocase TatA/TatE family subunit [Desulfobacula sp.]
MPEILMILAIALIVIGPKKLPDLAKTLGRALGEFKRSAQDFKRSIDVETTVKDIKDIDIPKTNLKDILKDTPTKDETASAAKDDSGLDDPNLDDPISDDSGKEEPENTIGETVEVKDPEDLNTDKTDTINPKTNKTD